MRSSTGAVAAAALFALALAAVVASCGADAPADDHPNNPEANFPAGFLWGTAVAGFQVEAGCPTLAAEACEDRASDWYQWVTDPDLVADDSTANSGDPVSLGPGMWETFDADFARARDELNTNAFRTSLEWSRLFPDGAAEAATTLDELDAHADPAAVAGYRAMFAAARARGLTLLVTLNHYTLPLWIHDGKGCHADLDACADRGWLDGPRIVRAIALYAGWCARTFGDQVDLWATLNEPFAMVLSGYILPSPDRTNPPGVLLRLPEAVAVLIHLIEGHAAMYDAVHANDLSDADDDGVRARVGVVHALVALEPKDPASAADAVAVEHADYIINRFFLEGVVRGALDRDLDGVAEEVRADLADRLDYLGINYYTRLPIVALGSPLDPRFPLADFLPDLGGGAFVDSPSGLYDVVTLASTYGRPMIITENGKLNPTADSGDAFLVPHLRELHRAMADGHPVEGYFYWSLVDNYEWNHGFALRFGLYELDLETKARTLRPIGRRYAEIIEARGF